VDEGDDSLEVEWWAGFGYSCLSVPSAGVAWHGPHMVSASGESEDALLVILQAGNRGISFANKKTS